MKKLLALLLSAGALLAHHGNSAYDETARVPIQGTVTEFIWVNPHSQIYLDVKDSSGKVVNWGIETNSPGILGRAGWTRRSLKAGDKITIDDFSKVELRVALVKVAERVPKADKLLRLEVDLGYEKRQILSGIAEWYTPEELIGKTIVIIANLAPRKMRGLESHGMLLAASHGENGKPILATFTEDIELGSRLK